MTPAETIYTVVLHLYPREHRQAYGQSMIQHACDLEREARERGRPYVAALYLRLIGDGIVNAGKEQWTVMRVASFKPIPWYAVLLAAIPGLWLVLVGLHPEPLAPLLPAIRNAFLILLVVALSIVWRRTRQVPVWALVPLGMLAWELVYLLGSALTSAAGQPGGGLAMVAVVVILNLVLAGVLFAAMLHGRRLPTAAVVVIVLMMLSSLPLLAQLNQSDFWNGRPFYWYLIPMLWGPSQALMLVAAGLLAARRHNVLALLVVIGGYGYRFLDADDLGVGAFSMRDWPGLSLYLASMTFLFFLLAPVAFLRAKTRLGRALALFLPASIFLAARLAVPALVLGQLTRILPGDALISSDILLGLILGWILYSHLGNVPQEIQPGSPQVTT